LVDVVFHMPLSVWINVFFSVFINPWVHVFWGKWISFGLFFCLNKWLTSILICASLSIVSSSDIWESEFSGRLWRSRSMWRIWHGVHTQVQNVDTLCLITDGRSGKFDCLARGK
jgi:hypothetical protein